MEEKVTIDKILNWFKEQVESHQPISVATWLDGAAKLNILLEDVDDEIDRMDFLMADKERILIKSGEPAAKAKILRMGAIDYEKYLKLKSKKNRIIEHIRIAKARQEHPNY